jgi:lysophospholipase L1-like esterase
MKWKKLIIIGDSNTQYGFSDESKWVSLLSNHFQRKCDVINRGFSGYNTDHLKLILSQILEEFDAESVCGFILMIGTNDSANDTNKLQHVPLNRFKTNLEYILDCLINFCKMREKIIFVSPARIHESKWSSVTSSKNEKCTHSDELVKNYAQISINVAREKNVSYLDLNELMRQFGPNYEELLFDGLHFSVKGGHFLFDNLVPILNSQIGDKLKFEFPYWRDIDLNKNKMDQ